MPATPTLGRLHVITDETLQSRSSHVDLARFAIAGGADAIQLREKRLKTARDLMEIASAIRDICASAGALFVVDDRVDVAAAVAAPAVHLGRNDLPVETARRLLGPDAIIGGTANSLEEALRVVRTPVSYIGVGPVYGTKSKVNPAPTLGLENLRHIVKASPVPVIAIGNIHPENVEEVLEAGAYGVAVLSGVVASDDPTAAARRYRAAIDGALAKKKVSR